MTEIKGHPSVDAHREEKPALQITVCAECEALSSVLYLSGDRWFCTKCRAQGDARPTQVPLTKPRKR